MFNVNYMPCFILFIYRSSGGEKKLMLVVLGWIAVTDENGMTRRKLSSNKWKEEFHWFSLFFLPNFSPQSKFWSHNCQTRVFVVALLCWLLGKQIGSSIKCFAGHPVELQGLYYFLSPNVF